MICAPETYCVGLDVGRKSGGVAALPTGGQRALATHLRPSLLACIWAWSVNQNCSGIMVIDATARFSLHPGTPTTLHPGYTHCTSSAVRLTRLLLLSVHLIWAAYAGSLVLRASVVVHRVHSSHCSAHDRPVGSCSHAHGFVSCMQYWKSTAPARRGGSRKSTPHQLFFLN